MFERDPLTAEIGKEILPFEVNYLPEFFRKKSEVELNDTEERKIQALGQIKELARNEKYMRDMVLDDDFLLQYLRARKFNVARAFSQLKAFVSFKKNYPKIFCNFQFENTVKTINNEIMTVLPWRCQDGCAIVFIQLDNWYPEEFSTEEVKKMVLIMLSQSLRDPMTQVNGFKIIFDVKSSPLRHLRHVTPQNLYLMVHSTQECIPGRYKGVHVVNDSMTFKAAWLVLKQFLSEKLRNRIHFHSSHETLANYFPKSILPVQYGGDLKDYDMSHWLKRVMQPEELEKMIGGKYENTN